MDLQDKVRGLDIRQDLDHIIDQISKLNVGLPLVWVWVWDVVMSTYEEFNCRDI